MLIDWFTVIAQALNFLILVWLMKRFLFVPVIRTIDAREERIRTQLKTAEERNAVAEKEKSRFEEKNRLLEQHKEKILQQAEQEVADQKREWLENARKEAEQLRNQLEKSLREDHEEMVREWVARTSMEVFKLARQVLKDLAAVSLEDHMARVFVSLMQQMDQQTREKLTREILSHNGSVRVRSAFELPDFTRKEIESLVRSLTNKETECRFETDPKLISGLSLSASGYKISWNVFDYISDLEKRLEAMLNGHT